MCLSEGPTSDRLFDGGAFFSDVTLELYLLPIFLSPSMEAKLGFLSVLRNLDFHGVLKLYK